MMPRNVAKSGMARTLLSRRDDRGADADAEQGDADGQAHGQHRAEGQDQDDDGEGEAEDLGRRLLELGEDEAAELDLRGRRSSGASSRISSRISPASGEVDVVGHLDVGVGDLAGVGALATTIWRVAALGVGALDAGRRRRCSATSANSASIAACDRGVVDALVGPEHDGAD